MNVLVYMVPVVAVVAAFYAAMRVFGRTGSGRKAMKVNFAAVALVFAVCMFGAMSALASPEKEAQQTTAATTAAQAAEETDDTAEAAAEETAADMSMAVGLGLLAAALSTSLSGIGGGIAVASAAPAAIGATSEDPKAFGKALIFVALGESIALYGLVISIMILNKVPTITL